VTTNTDLKHSFAKRLGLQPLYMAAATGLSQVSLAIVYVLAARDVGPVEFGRVIAAIAMGNVGAGLIDFGSNALWVRERAKGILPNETLARKTFSKLLCATGVMSAWIAGVLVLAPDTPLWMAAPIAISVLLNQSLQVPLKGIGRSDRVALAVLVERTSALGLIFVMIVLGLQPAEVLWLVLCLGSLSAGVTAMMTTPAGVRPIARFGWENPWAGARNFGLAGWAVSVQSLDVPLLGAVSGGLQAGLFGAVSRWTQPMGLLAAAFASTAAPFVARSKSMGETWSLVRGSAWLLLMAVVLCVGVFVGADWVVVTLIGDSFASSALVLRILALGTIPAIISQPLSVFLQQMGHDGIVSRIVIFTVLVQLGLVAGLGAWMGATGAALSYLVVQCLTLSSLTLVAAGARKKNRTKE
jgi:O-antigen/teichoic acid export membrane protein